MTGRARPRRALPLRHHLLLDAAALLGAGPDQAGRLRQGRHPDDARGAGRGADQVRDAGVHAHAAAAHHPAVALRRARAVLRGRGRAARRAAPLVLPPASAGDRRSRRSRGRCTGTRCSTSPCSSSPWASTARCRSGGSRCPTESSTLDRASSIPAAPAATREHLGRLITTKARRTRARCLRPSVCLRAFVVKSRRHLT